MSAEGRTGSGEPVTAPPEAGAHGSIGYLALAGAEAVQAAAEFDVSRVMYSPGESGSREELVRKVAYLRAERRGFEPGGQLDDWLGAERAVDQWIAIHGLPAWLAREEPGPP